MYNNPGELQPSSRYRSSNPSQQFDPGYLDDPNYHFENYHQDNIPRNTYPTNFTSNNPDRSNLLNSKIKYSPKFFANDMFSEKRYKGPQTILSTKTQLPQLVITPSLRTKIQKSVSQPVKKDSYLFITKQSGNYTSDKKFIVDEISYAIEEAIEENYYNENKYPVLLVTSPPADYDNNLDMQSEISLIEDLCKVCRRGSPSLLSGELLYHQRNTDFTVPASELEFNQPDIQALQSSDIIYLNTFRIFTFVVRSSNTSSSKFAVHRLLYFPNVSFTLSLIHQPFKKLVSTPLTSTLLAKKQGNNILDNQKQDIKFGFISLDANQRMLPIAVSDPLASKIPLIGVWIHGINPDVELMENGDPEKRVLQGILFEYINNTALVNRYSFDKTRKMLLLAIFSPEGGHKFYETEFMENMESPEIDNKWLMLKASRETLNLGDGMDYLERNFVVSSESIVRDVSSLKKELLETTQRSNKETINPRKGINQNNSFNDYLFGDSGPQPMKQSFRIEEDSFDMEHQAPNPMPQPQPQPKMNHMLGESQQTSHFANSSEDTLMLKETHRGRKGGNSGSQEVMGGDNMNILVQNMINQQGKHIEFLQEENRGLKGKLEASEKQIAEANAENKRHIEEIGRLKGLLASYQSNLEVRKPEVLYQEPMLSPGFSKKTGEISPGNVREDPRRLSVKENQEFIPPRFDMQPAGRVPQGYPGYNSNERNERIDNREYQQNNTPPQFGQFRRNESMEPKGDISLSVRPVEDFPGSSSNFTFEEGHRLLESSDSREKTLPRMDMPPLNRPPEPMVQQHQPNRQMGQREEPGQNYLRPEMNIPSQTRPPMGSFAGYNSNRIERTEFNEERYQFNPSKYFRGPELSENREEPVPYPSNYGSSRNVIRSEAPPFESNIQSRTEPTAIVKEPELGRVPVSYPVAMEALKPTNEPVSEKRVLTEITNNKAEEREIKEPKTVNLVVEYQQTGMENITPNIPKFNRPPLHPEKELLSEEPKKNVNLSTQENKSNTGGSMFTVLKPIGSSNNSIQIPVSKVVEIEEDPDEDEILRKLQARFAMRNNISQQ